jgi:beta-N-acetylhexosaminidase
MAAGAASTAARLTWAVVPGFDFDDRAERIVRQGFGGYVLGTRNLDDPAQIRHLTAAMRAASPVPVRLGIDQEGGHVFRIGSPLTRFPGPMAIGATGSSELARSVARATARELRWLGIDTVFAPVLDVLLELGSAVVGVRSYGSDPLLVARLGTAAIHGYLEGGVIPVAKHFPGHGGTSADTHFAPARDPSGAVLMDAVHLLPFRDAIAAGVPSLMTSHVTYDSLGDGQPASLSHAAIAGLARSRLRFDGFVVTDALVMDAVRIGRKAGQSGVDSLASGADAVLAMDVAPAVSATIGEAIESGRLDDATLGTAVRRADTLDRLATVLRSRRADEAGPPWQEHAELAAQVARESLTLVRHESVLPIDPSSRALLIELVSRRASPVEERGASEVDLASELGRRLPKLLTLRLRYDDIFAAAVAVEAAAVSPVTIVATRDAYLGHEERTLLRVLNDLGRPLIAVALRSPLDLTLMPDASAAIATYGDVPATSRALADALVTGSRSFRGHLPISLPTEPEEAAA